MYYNNYNTIEYDPRPTPRRGPPFNTLSVKKSVEWGGFDLPKKFFRRCTMQKFLPTIAVKFDGRKFYYNQFNGVVFYVHPQFIKDGEIQFPVVNCKLLEIGKGYIIAPGGDWTGYLLKVRGENFRIKSDEEIKIVKKFDKEDNVTRALIFSRADKLLLYWSTEKDKGVTALHKDGRVETLPGITASDFCLLWENG